MVACIAVPARYNMVTLATAAGNPSVEDRWYAGGCLHVRGVTQQALDDALAIYNYLDTVRERKKVSLARDADNWLYAQFSLQRLVFAALNIGTAGDIAKIKTAAQERNRALSDAEAAVDAAADEAAVDVIVFENYLL